LNKTEESCDKPKLKFTFFSFLTD